MATSQEKASVLTQTSLKPFINRLWALSQPIREIPNKIENKIGREWRGENFVEEKAHQTQAEIDSFENPQRLADGIKKLLMGMQWYYDLLIKEPPMSDKQIVEFFINAGKTISPDAANFVPLVDEWVAYGADPEKYKAQIKNSVQKYFEESIPSLLFFIKRKFVLPDKFNKAMELDQIKAFYHTIIGDQPDMRTGGAKTQVVEPVALIFESLTNHPITTSKGQKIIPLTTISPPDKSIQKKTHQAVSEVSGLLQAVIHNLGDKLTPEARSHFIRALAVTQPVEIEASQTTRLEKFFRQSPTILQNAFGCNITRHDQIVFGLGEQYIRLLFDELGVDFFSPSTQPKDETQTLDYQQAAKNALIRLKETVGKIIFDESHFLPEAPYKEGQPPLELPKFDIDDPSIQASLTDYCLGRWLAELIKNDGDFVNVTKNKAELSSHGREKIKTLIGEVDAGHQLLITHGHSKDNFLLNTLYQVVKKEVIPNMRFSTKVTPIQLIRVVLNYFETQINQDSQFGHQALHEHPEGLGMTGVAEFEEKDSYFELAPKFYYLMSLAENIIMTDFMYKKGRDYMDDETILRDRSRGTLLERRQLYPQTAFFVRLLNRQGPLIKPPENVLYEFNIETWMALLGDKTSGLTADYSQVTDKFGGRSLTPYAKTIQDLTASHIIDFHQAESGQPLPIPLVKICDGNIGLIQQMVDNLSAGQKKQKKPELVIFWEEDLARALFNQLKKRGARVELITADTSSEEDTAIESRFSNGVTDVLITSGRKGYGADFKDRQGNHLDLRVTVANPQTFTQINQAFGRRRLEKHLEDFDIFFEKDFLLQLFTHFPDTKPTRWPWNIGITTYSEAEKLLNQCLLNSRGSLPEKLNDLVLESLRLNQFADGSDPLQTVRMELFFLTQVMPRVIKTKLGLIRETLANKKSPLSSLINKRVEVIGHDLDPKLKRQIKKKIVDQVVYHFCQTDASLFEEFKQLMTTASLNFFIAGRDAVVLSETQAQLQDLIDSCYLPFWQEQISLEAYPASNPLPLLIEDQILLQQEILDFITSKSISPAEMVGFDDLSLPFPYYKAASGTRPPVSSYFETITLLPSGESTLAFHFAGTPLSRSVSDKEFKTWIQTINEKNKRRRNDQDFVDLLIDGVSTRMLRVYKKRSVSP